MQPTIQQRAMLFDRIEPHLTTIDAALLVTRSMTPSNLSFDRLDEARRAINVTEELLDTVAERTERGHDPVTNVRSMLNGRLVFSYGGGSAQVMLVLGGLVLGVGVDRTPRDESACLGTSLDVSWQSRAVAIDAELRLWRINPWFHASIGDDA